MNAKENLVREGETCTVLRDVVIEGKVAFRKGDRVTVEKITSNPDRPDYRYVVKSELLQKRFQLSDRDISVQPAPEAGPGAFATTGAPSDARVVSTPTSTRESRLNSRLILALALAVVVAAGIGVTLWLFLGRDSAEAKIGRLKKELTVIVEDAGDTTSDLSAEIKQAQEKAPNPESFKPLGEKIAQKYIPRYRRYYREASEIYNELSDFKPPDELKEQYASLLTASDSYRQAFVTYVAALDQVRKGQIPEAVKILSQVKALLDKGNQALKGNSGSENVPGQ